MDFDRTRFGGTMRIPVKLTGSLFWGRLSGVLAETELGEYRFGDEIQGSSARRLLRMRAASPQIPDFFAGGDLAISANGTQMTVFTANSNGGSGGPDPDVYYRIAGNSGGSALIRREAERWETDPAVTFLDADKALAVWTSNDGDKNLQDLNEILAHQDIRYAVWTRNSGWTMPAAVSDDSEADGLAQVAYDGSRAVAAWVHDANRDRDLNTRTEWEIHAAVYNPATDTWSAPRALSGADDQADYAPAVAAAAGNTLVVWAKDADGEFYEFLGDPEQTTCSVCENGSNVRYNNRDAGVYYALYNGSAWSGGTFLPGSSGAGSIFSPSAAWSPDGRRAVVTWMNKQAATDENGRPTGLNNTRVYAAYWNGSAWSAPQSILTADYAIEDPQVIVNRANQAVLVWRGTRDNPQGEIYRACFDPQTGREQAFACSPSSNRTCRFPASGFPAVFVLKLSR